MMRTKLLFTAATIALVLAGAGCVQSYDELTLSPDQTPEAMTDDQSAAPAITPETTADTMMQAPKEGWLAFENRAIGYTISHPEYWHWVHYIDNQIPTPGVKDYFITDPKAIDTLNPDDLGEMSIIATSDTVEQLKQHLAFVINNAEHTETTIDGNSAERISGTRTDGPNKDAKNIHVIFTHNGTTFDAVYLKTNSTDQDEARFDEFVRSLAFKK